MDSLTHSEHLGLKISLVEARLDRSCRAFLAHPSLREIFPEYLFRLHCAVRAIVPLMETALARASAMADFCPVAAALVPYLTQHIEEETGHDEWLLEDMQILGMSRADVLSRPPARTVAALVGAQYYWVLHAHPVAFLGYATVVEGTPVRAETLDHLVQAGIPRGALRTLYLHAELDIGHGAEAAQFLDGLPLTADHSRLIGLSALHSIEQLSLVIDELVHSPNPLEMIGVAELKTLLVCDLVDSTRLVERLGDTRAAALFRRLDEQTRALVDRWRGREIDKTDGFLLLFDRPINAVRFAVDYQSALAALSKETGVELSARVGIHVGEVVIRENPAAEVARGAKPVEVEGLAKAVAARLMSLARGGQTLLSRAAYDVAHRSTVGGVENGTLLEWRAHGAYRLKGVTEPLEVFEVGVPGVAVLTAPADSEKARRVGRNGRPGILVLPFADLSPEADTGHISHGLADEIISSLSGLEALRVISRSAAVQLKETGKDTASLAAELGVEYVLEGSVQRAGASLLIATRLLRPEQGELVWGKSFRGDLQALFDIEQTISESVVGALRVRLTATETERLKTRSIPDVRAYEYYLRAKQQVYSFTEDALDRALHYLEKGAELIGENVQIYAAMGYVYWQYINLGVKSDPVYLEKARECAERIRAVDPQSPEADRLLGLVTIFARGDIQHAVRHLKRALEGNRSDPDALFWLALLYGFVGMVSSGYPLAERLLEIDPLSAVVHAIPPTLAALGGEFDRACALFAKAHQMEPDNPAINFVYCQALAMAGRRDEACALVDRIERDAPSSFYHGLGSVLRAALRGNKAAAHAALEPAVEEGAKADMQYSWTLAQCFSLLGETESSVQWLENAVARGFSNYPIIAELDPLLEGVRGDAGFQKVARTAKEKWQAFEV